VDGDGGGAWAAVGVVAGPVADGVGVLRSGGAPPCGAFAGVLDVDEECVSVGSAGDAGDFGAAWGGEEAADLPGRGVGGQEGVVAGRPWARETYWAASPEPS
jgi:hypothetical protein